jgi:hypothetical protein
MLRHIIDDLANVRHQARNIGCFFQIDLLPTWTLQSGAVQRNGKTTFLHARKERQRPSDVEEAITQRESLYGLGSRFLSACIITSTFVDLCQQEQSQQEQPKQKCIRSRNMSGSYLISLSV